jgi:hypothetical protein
VCSFSYIATEQTLRAFLAACLGAVIGGFEWTVAYSANCSLQKSTIMLVSHGSLLLRQLTASLRAKASISAARFSGHLLKRLPTKIANTIEQVHALSNRCVEIACLFAAGLDVGVKKKRYEFRENAPVGERRLLAVRREEKIPPGGLTPSICPAWRRRRVISR